MVTAIAAPAAAAPRANAAAPDLDKLLARFKASPGVYARFREEKHLAMLDTPLINEGTIHFAPPGRLARHTEKPLQSTLLIDGDKLQFGDANGAETLDLASNPMVRPFVDSFVMVLTGNRAGLERLFTMKLASAGTGTGENAGWRLALAPRVSPMNKVIQEITVAGDGIAIRQVEIRETSGDWSRTTFSDVDVNRRYTPAEQAKIFRLPKR
jgi:hypothetical protein